MEMEPLLSALLIIIYSRHCIVCFFNSVCGQLNILVYISNNADMKKCSMLGITLAVTIATVLTTQAAGESKR